MPPLTGHRIFTVNIGVIFTFKAQFPRFPTGSQKAV
jgi:hypothetical protein